MDLMWVFWGLLTEHLFWIFQLDEDENLLEPFFLVPWWPTQYPKSSCSSCTNKTFFWTRCLGTGKTSWFLGFSLPIFKRVPCILQMEMLFKILFHARAETIEMSHPIKDPSDANVWNESKERKQFFNQKRTFSSLDYWNSMCESHSSAHVKPSRLNNYISPYNLVW